MITFKDRCRLLRKQQTPSGPEFVELYPSVACVFEVLSVAMASMWANPADDYTITQGNLHLALTLVDLPEPNFVLSDYQVEVLSPQLGWIKENGARYWTIITKRNTRNHVIYLMAI